MRKLLLVILSAALAACCEFEKFDGNTNHSFVGFYANPEGPEEGPFVKTDETPDSTFGIDVDTASYTLARAQLRAGARPDFREIRSEEFINFFSYDYAEPVGTEPMAVHFEYGVAPWNREHRLIKIGLKGKSVPFKKVPPLNLVFLIDVSGSMNDETRLDLVKLALLGLTEELRDQDRISIVTYNFQVTNVLEGVSGSNKAKIRAAIQSLQAFGGTAGGPGIQMAYDIAARNQSPGGVDRIILSTDGDFNVGISDTDQLKEYVMKRAKEGITLTVHGYGMGNYMDNRLETLADNGNGNYAYIDSVAEADRVFRAQISNTLTLVAKDVKLKVSFAPETVEAYRLIGYENRKMSGDEFSNPDKDTGDLGAGMAVTALYEVIPREDRGKLLHLAIRYKDPFSNASASIEKWAEAQSCGRESADFRFASAAAAFALKLGQSKYLGEFSWQNILDLANSSLGDDKDGYRREFLELVKNAAEF